MGTEKAGEENATMMNPARRHICLTLKHAGWHKSRRGHWWRDPNGKTFSTTTAAWAAYHDWAKSNSTLT